MYYKSNSKPEKFSFKDYYDGVVKVYLRTNIKQVSDNIYTYNEYTVLVNKTEHIQEDIELNFDAYLTQGKANEEIEIKKSKIDGLEKQLEKSDYKIIKCTENFMLNAVLPYDFSTLLSQRIKWRNEINTIEEDSLIEGLTIEQEKERKIMEMMACCQSTIANGIDYNNEHYRLNTTDQINLTSLGALAQTGKSVPYHADGQVCRIYTAKEMLELVQKATAFITYHTTYFNLLKHTILNMTDINEIKAVQYGIELSEEYQAILNAIITS